MASRSTSLMGPLGQLVIAHGTQQRVHGWSQRDPEILPKRERNGDMAKGLGCCHIYESQSGNAVTGRGELSRAHHDVTGVGQAMGGRIWWSSHINELSVKGQPDDE